MDTPQLPDIAHVIQLAVAPVFLLAGVGAIINVLAGRAKGATACNSSTCCAT